MTKKYIPVSQRKNRQVSILAKQKAIAERRQLLLSLRQAGASYSEIVRAGIGYKSVGHVADDMKKVLAKFQYETPEDVLVLDLARLDEMQKLATAAMRSGDKAIMGTIMQIMRFRRETLGITSEQIADRALSKTQVQNNGIMVIQGTSTGDYVAAMAQAVGANPDEVKKELSRIAKSNEIVDAEFSENDPKDLPFERRMLKSAEINDARNHNAEVLPVIDLESPLLNVDMPLEIPIKQYDANVEMTSGIAYQIPPRKPTKDESRKVVRIKLKKSKNANLEIDHLERETIQKEI